MDNLFSHPGFKLIFVDDDDIMSLVIPLEHKEDIIEKGYRCISHVWKTGTQKEHIWDDHPIKGVTWEVEVRKEKHGRLLQVFKHHKGYFWMDVFCTNQEDVNKPLEVMGDIYKKSMECVCLLDYECNMEEYETERDIFEKITEELHGFIEAKKRGQETSNDDISDDDTDDDASETFVEDLYTHCYTGYYDPGDYPVYEDARINYFIDITECGWTNRMWTWQESILPPKIVFCSERKGIYRYAPIDKELISRILPLAHNAGRQGEFVEYFCRVFMDKFWGEKKDMMTMIKQIPLCNRVCMNEADYIYSICGILDVEILPDLDFSKAFAMLLDCLWNKGCLVDFGGGRLDAYPHQGYKLPDIFQVSRCFDDTNFVQVYGETDVKYLDCGEILRKIHVGHEREIEGLMCRRCYQEEFPYAEELFGFSLGDSWSNGHQIRLLVITVDGVRVKNVTSDTIRRYLEGCVGDLLPVYNKYIYVTTRGYLVMDAELEQQWEKGETLEITYARDRCVDENREVWFVERKECGRRMIIGGFKANDNSKKIFPMVDITDDMEYDLVKEDSSDDMEYESGKEDPNDDELSSDNIGEEHE